MPNPAETFPTPDVIMEDLALSHPEVAAELQQVFETTPLADITEQTGLGLNELSQVITVETETGVKSGTLAAAIANPRCPAGKMVRGRFDRKGFGGVEELLDDWKQDDPGLAVTVSASTRAQHHLKKN